MKSFFSVLLRTVPLLLIAIATYFWAQYQWDPHRSGSPPEAVRTLTGIGKPALDFELSIVQDPMKKWRLSSIKGSPIIINFWATWCGPCVEEMPALIEVAKKYKAQGLRVVAISVDRDLTTLQKFFTRYPRLKEAEQVFTLLFDPLGDSAKLYGIDRFPESFLVNKNFQVELRLSGEQAWLDPRYETYYNRILK